VDQVLPPLQQAQGRLIRYMLRHLGQKFQCIKHLKIALVRCRSCRLAAGKGMGEANEPAR